MKILAVSLLRLGDVFMAAPTLAGLRRLYPDAELHVLVNREALGASALLEGVDRWHVFEREKLQCALADHETPILDPFFRLEGQIQRLRALEFDLVLNLTHNRLSGWLCGAIHGRQTVGLALDQQGRPCFGSSWFQFLNDNAHLRGSETFHYADVFWFGSGLNHEPRQWGWRSRPEAEVEADTVCAGASRVVAIQPFSSEEKKEWSAEAWAQALKRLRLAPLERIVVFAAPSERQKADGFMRVLDSQNVEATLSVCSLAGAAAILKRASLFLTLDTSIKHLAAPLNVPVIEISLGSSDWRRTGIYKSGSFIVQGRAACAPCPHSQGCSEPFHRCGSAVEPDLVAAIGRAILDQTLDDIHNLARASSGQCQIFKTTIAGGEFWQGRQMGRDLGAVDVRQWLDKLTSKMMLQGEHLLLLGAYGTAALRLGEWIKSEFAGFNVGAWRLLIQDVERDGQSFQDVAASAKKRLQDLMLSSRDQTTVEMKDMRALQGRIEDAKRRLEIRQRLVRSLKNVVEGTL